MKKFKIGIALSGGALCGVAHVGFLKALEENGIKIDMISGISIGSIVGGLYASGMSIEEMEKLALKVSKNDIIELNFFKILKESLFTGKRIEKILRENLKTEMIEDAKIEFYAQAIDMLTGKLVTFEKGPFVEALRASSAVPGIFAPVYKDNTFYIDGGVLENIPYNILKEKGADVIIAVNCLNDYKLEVLPKNVFGTMMNTFYIMQEEIWKDRSVLYKDNYDILCHDNLEGIDALTLKLNNVDKIIEAGYESGKRYVKEIKEIIKNKKNLLKNA